MTKMHLISLSPNSPSFCQPNGCPLGKELRAAACRFMRYKPKTVRILLEVFLTYIAPVHYNAIRYAFSCVAIAKLLSGNYDLQMLQGKGLRNNDWPICLMACES
jgi:hypothetical protein